MKLRLFTFSLLLWAALPTISRADSTSQAAGFGAVSWYDYRDQTFNPDLNNYGSFYQPIVIDTPEKLAQLAWLVNEGHNTFTGCIFTLGADIDLNRTENGERVHWVPIGYSGDHTFNGMFIGMEKGIDKAVWQEEYSHSISGMYIDAAIPTSQMGLRAIGLFGCVKGYLGHLRLTDCHVNVTTDGNQTFTSYLLMGAVGLLCGESREQGYTDDTIFEEMRTGYFHAPHGIYDAQVDGTIAVGGYMNFYVGGVVGSVYSSKGVCHTTADVSVTYTSLLNLFAGGICGSMSEGASAYDCGAHFMLSGDGSKVNDAGGVVGELQAGTSAVGCTASGSIYAYTTQTDGSRGGICGVMHANTLVKACVSTMYVDGKYNVGGIVGRIHDSTNENTGAPYVDGCMFAGHINVFQGQNVGGICGTLDDGTSSPANRGLYINGSLMAGTMSTTLSSNVGTVAGALPTPVENVGGCYYDKTLAKGDAVGGTPTHASIRGLTTDVLTSGNVSKVTMLDTDETAETGFTLTGGYYPQVFCHAEWPGYKVLDNDYNNSNLSLRLAQSRPYWRYAEVDKSNSVYEPGAWLASVPLTIPKGDAAYDLVTYVAGKEKEGIWNETNGREVKVKAKVSYPQDNDCISVSGDTARVVSDGTFITTYTLKNSKEPLLAFNRPLPLGGTKPLFIQAMPKQEWDGTVATEFAAGTGTADDPYIIKNGAQLARAVMNNAEGEWYKQLCDITLVKDLINYSSYYLSGTNYAPYDLNNQSRIWGYSRNYEWNPATIGWKARYNGDGHLVKGAYIGVKEFGLFGSIAASGVVENLGLTDCYSEYIQSGLLAYKMDGTVTNCLLQGVIAPIHNHDEDSHLGYSGGICAYVGPTNSEAIVEDCVTAVYSCATLQDYSPFVSLPLSGNALQNHGRVTNCLAVVPTSFGDATFNYEYTAAGHSYIDNCYWLRGYEPTDTGQSLEEIYTALGSRSRWTYSKGYFPTLKSFAQTDIARLMTIPVRTDDGYDDGYDQYLLGFDHQLLFEPGSAEWTCTDEMNVSIEADGDMGIIVPVSASFDYKDSGYIPHTRYVLHQEQIVAHLGNATYAIPVRTRGGQVNPGITIEDMAARSACMGAFDTDGNNVLSLAEVKVVDAAALNAAFQDTQHHYAKSIRSFPELRFFKNVTSLTTQLNGLPYLREVKLPYALQRIGSDAFSGCTRLKEVTIPAKVTDIDQHPFYGSAIENVSVDPFNEDFKARSGVLYDVNDVLVAYPNGRTGEEAVLEGRIIEIADGAIYLQNGLQRLYFETDDYETVPYLNYDGIVTTDGNLIDVYVSDATYGSVLMQAYNDDGSWDEYIDAGKLHCYYPLTVTGAKAATMYIGFDTELPAELKPYIVTSTDDTENKAYLRSMERRVPSRTPVVILAEAAGKYRLMPLDEPLEPWKMYKNQLNGVNRDGMPVNQGDSDRGSILTLGYNSARVLGFYYYKGSRIAPFRAYLTYDWVNNAAARYTISFAEDDEPTGIEEVKSEEFNVKNDGAVYDLQGRRVGEMKNEELRMMNKSNSYSSFEGEADIHHSSLSPGIYIIGGKKVLVRP